MSTINLEIPASSAYVALARAAVSALCARMDFTLDRIEDSKLAIDEACAMLIRDAGASITIEFEVGDAEHLSVRLATAALDSDRLQSDSHEWSLMVLCALADVHEVSNAGVHELRLRLSRETGDELATT